MIPILNSQEINSNFFPSPLAERQRQDWRLVLLRIGLGNYALISLLHYELDYTFSLAII